MVKTLDKILVNTHVRQEDIFINTKGEEMPLTNVTQKLIYEEILLRTNSKDHYSQAKLFFRLKSSIIWEDVWSTVHNILSSNETKTVIWQQIHINFYTQYSYNKWHKKQDTCPLCLQVPKSIFHIMLECDFVNELWQKIQPHLITLYPIPVSDVEKILGIARKTQKTGSLLRNWITFMLRKTIMQEERIAYHAATKPNAQRFLQKFANSLRFEIQKKLIRYEHEDRLSFFDEVMTFQGVLCKKVNGAYEIQNLSE